jgi:hypothetical protein
VEWLPRRARKRKAEFRNGRTADPSAVAASPEYRPPATRRIAGRAATTSGSLQVMSFRLTA